MQEIGIMDVGGFQVGHAQDLEGATGCTVILCDRMSPAGLDVRGGGPASRESQILNPVAAAEGINAVLLSGGSAFGLDAAGGVQRYLEERGIGFDTGVAKVRLACLIWVLAARRCGPLRTWPIRPVRTPAGPPPPLGMWAPAPAAPLESTVEWTGR